MANVLADQNGKIKIAAYDHRDSLKKFVAEEFIPDFKRLLTEEIGPLSTAVLVDPFYGQPSIKAALEKDVPLILSREESGYTDNPDGRLTTLSQYTSKDLKEMGASAIKILLYFNSKAPNVQEQIEVVKKVARECAEIDLPFLIEPITYEIPGIEYDKGQETLNTLSMLYEYADVLKIEYPTDVKTEPLEKALPYLNEVTHMLQGKPWILLSRGNMDFETFVKALEICKQAGGSGYAVGRAIWQEVQNYKTWPEIENFVKTTVKDRVKQLNQLF